MRIFDHVSLLRPGASALLLLLGSVKAAHAYVDPGTGAMLWQALAASAVGALFYLRKLNPFHWLRGMVRRGKPQG